MKLIRPLLCLLSAIFFSPVFGANSHTTVSGLRCEYLGNPVGIDVPRPRLFWKLESEAYGEKQTAYQVLVAQSPEALNRNEGDIWDSGRVESNQAVFVPYNGNPLLSRQKYWWKVRVWDKNSQPTTWSTVACWTMGILDPDEWRGEWIESDLELMKYQQDLRALPDFGMEPENEIWQLAERIRPMTKDVTTAPAVFLRREFETTSAVKRASLYIAGLGYHEVYLNGQRVGDRQLDPAPTDYDKRVIYVTHDVTDAVQSGKNALGVVLGNSWYNLVVPHVLRYYAADYIAPPRLRLELDVEYADGSHAVIVSDPAWKYTTNGPIRFNSVLGGETYDARMELPGWSKCGYNDEGWQPARLASAPRGRLTAGLFPPARITHRIPATTMTLQGHTWRFDAVEEAAGWARVRVRGPAGREITIRFPGSDSHTLGRYQTCKYICKGSGDEFFESRFSYNGFRYVEISGLDYTPKPEDVEIRIVGTDMEQTGSFMCSDDRLNMLQDVLIRTLRNYYCHLPSDPTREKAGWSQDVETVFLATAYNQLCAPTYIKWQRDFLDVIHHNGYVPPVVPGRFDGPTINGPWWGGAVIYNPWYIYQFYGDRGILEESYPAMQKQFKYLENISHNEIVEWGLGDWLEVGSVRPQRTPVPFTSTCAYYWFADILRQTSELLGQSENSYRYKAKAAEIKQVFNTTYLNTTTGDYATSSQACQLLPLVLGLTPQERRNTVLQQLARRIAEDNFHLTTGFVSTPLLLNGLTDLGRGDLAWRIATQEDYPGFIDATLNRGNSVMKEDWNGGQVQMPTLQGAIGPWFYHSLAGIRPTPETPGFKHFVLSPETSGTVTWVRAHLDTLHGRIVSNWNTTDSGLLWNITVPPNTSATVCVPANEVKINTKPLSGRIDGVLKIERHLDRVEILVGAGTYQIEACDYWRVNERFPFQLPRYGLMAPRSGVPQTTSRFVVPITGGS